MAKIRNCSARKCIWWYFAAINSSFTKFAIQMAFHLDFLRSLFFSRCIHWLAYTVNTSILYIQVVVERTASASAIASGAQFSLLFRKQTILVSVATCTFTSIPIFLCMRYHNGEPQFFFFFFLLHSFILRILEPFQFATWCSTKNGLSHWTKCIFKLQLNTHTHTHINSTLNAFVCRFLLSFHECVFHVLLANRPEFAMNHVQIPFFRRCPLKKKKCKNFLIKIKNIYHSYYQTFGSTYSFICKSVEQSSFFFSLSKNYPIISSSTWEKMTRWI